ncbi:M6 family metalloprotease domain-containing protein [Streptomyces sp. H10-C2]|uniref:M6 family metalloprotease domain-containing protein n=1 Tax=unclassified Streptomyces TaxID=2593676 RepID=UPI0024B9EAD0|nr:MULTISPECIES: M6 family metalloprotease domain-containing protein [unclassified Streptomyces]MDJ0339992.1 M6 family metalloprotease domain-containing protein [Streptomyces sp. PH10-H1]MDJ0369371.1 M6 family metalloprotease domain-containing protein [Streptomyces sp. H10-C2]
MAADGRIPRIPGLGLKAAAVGAVALLAAASTAAPGPIAAYSPPTAARPCALRATPGTAMSEGFPDHAARGVGSEFAPSTGRVRALTLFIDFSDAPAPYSARERYAEFFPAVQQWFARGSYGKLRYESTPVLRYLRMPRPFSSYGIGRGYGWDAHTAMMRDLLAVADHSIDFRGYDLVNILVTPNAGPPADEAVLSVTWTGASAATTDDGARLDRVSLIYGHDQSGSRVLGHENGHAFGLPDLYAADDFQHTDTLVGQWDSMSLDWGLGGDLLAWHKWRLGWLDDTQIACAAVRGDWTYALRAVSLPGGRKAVVVPYGRTRAYVIEARQASGNDREACREGVLVYQVRTDIDSGAGPVTVRDAHPGTSACDFSSGSFNSLNDAPFQVGEDYADPASGLKVKVLGRTRTGEWEVRVSRR